ncbi:Carbohydrate-selective porin, OprB family [Xenococcus sp. PCC 7305]|uniref:iron uptake porin n=1 Tax=Xenococcus sp. PCC 7305 TaxID=102125 RepID=UPI0002ABD268|nr:iron uptake porin [Xenococcus sp. PCC 7305]ELS04969.1 Carbohydrate-selective porin, OprB family [Xenococcus sp. PCC 7305]
MTKISQLIINLGVVTIISMLGSSVASANELANELEDVNFIYKLKSIQLTDWEFQALQSLAENNICTAELTKNSRIISRYEFALELDNCLRSRENPISQEDLAILQRLRQDFALELANLSAKVKQLETNITQLKSNNFSPTAKLNGQILFFLADSFGQEDDSQTFSGFRTRLDFGTSFSGQDKLNIRLENRNIGRLDNVTDTLLSRLSVDGSSDNRTKLAELSYTFKLGDRTKMVFGTTGVGLNDIGEVLNPFSSSGDGAISRFGRRDPATLRGPGGSGIGIKHEFSKKILVNAGYVINSQDVANPEKGKGLFDSSASAIAQLMIKPEDDLAVALAYTHSYQRINDLNLLSGTGVEDANQPFGNKATTSDNFGLQFNWAITSGLEIGGWFGYTQASQQQNGSERATILNGALTLAFPDLWAENNFGGIIIGVPPAIADHDDKSLITEETPFHIEALYRIEINKNIEITPGFFVIINPDRNDDYALWIGTVRTRISF